MDTSALKTFAPAVRRQLIEAVTRKLDHALTAQTPDLLTTFAPQVAALRKLAETDRAGLIDRVAYTWFNRFAALRFLDARGWHPFRARVLTPASPAETQPELLKLTRTGALPAELQAHTDPQRLNDLLDGRIPTSTPGADPQGEVYCHLVLAACRFYHALLPNLFEKLDDGTELILPDDLLTEHSVVHGFRTEISDEDCGDAQRANVEILGWLYQFYISERKDQIMARKSAVPTEDIPAVTQLFTPHWIVRYLVENSLGRLWLLNRPGSRLREHMPYYIEGEPETDFLRITKPEEIRLCDPAVGSGHMLTYAFDLLTLIYEEEGYAPSEIPALILRHNLHGLEICPRAAQLAELALVFKAREKSRRFFQPEQLVRPNIIELRDVRFEENELRDYIRALGLGDLFNQPMLRLLHQFEEAKNFGSLIQPCLDERAIAFARRAIEAKDLGGQLFLRETHLKVLHVLDQAEALTQRYHVVVANPPYMGSGAMNARLKVFLADTLKAGKPDLYAAFMVRNLSFVEKRGFVGMITIPNWMFLQSFEPVRDHLIATGHICSLVHNGRGVWGGDFGSCSFVIEKHPQSHRSGVFKRLFKRPGEIQSNAEIEANFFNSSAYPSFEARSSDFAVVPGSPIAYWMLPATRRIFETNEPLGNLVSPCVGLQTNDNTSFLRQWHEVGRMRCNLGGDSRDRGGRWFAYNKGGEFRKWYGNNTYVINWEDNGRDIKERKKRDLAAGRITPNNSKCWNESKYFREAVTWSELTSSNNSFRYSKGAVFDITGPSVFPTESISIQQLLSYSNGAFFSSATKLLNPTLHFNPGNFRNIPAALLPHKVVAPLVDELIAAAKLDWDNFETSWDFRDLPFLRPGLKGATLEASWRNWEAHCTAAIRRMQELETENNRLFIAAYGLEGELQPEVPEEQITIARADARRDMAAFLSYAVGCMMGRYALNRPGLVIVNSGDVFELEKDQNGKVLSGKVTHAGESKPFYEIDPASFFLDEDGILPVLDGEWFEDDIVARTRDFLRATFGEATLRENLRFLEDSLGKDLRKYFLNDFYKDHLQTYKKRPIYWMVQSPRKGFSVLIYLHRYTRDAMNVVLNRYLRDYQAKLRNRLTHLIELQLTAPTAKAKTEARKEADKLTKILHECEEWERQTLLPLAQARIELDLDDGVKVNYLKLGEALAPIAGLAAKDEE